MSDTDVNINLDSNNSRNEMADDIERDIIGLKQMLDFLAAKLREIKLDYLNKDYKGIEDHNLEQKRSQLLESTIKRLLIGGATQNVIRNEFLRTHVMKLKTSDLGSQNYKENIIEQLELLRATSVQRKDLHDKQLKLLEENRQIQLLIEHGDQLKTNLEQAVRRRENDNQLNSSYKAQIAGIEKRINKINFMQTITNQLLTHGDIDWQKQSHLVELIVNFRTKYNMEDLLK